MTWLSTTIVAMVGSAIVVADTVLVYDMLSLMLLMMVMMRL